jgi:hypothetical protein
MAEECYEKVLNVEASVRAVELSMMNRQGRRSLKLAIGAAIVLLGALFALEAGRILVVDAPKSSDVILVLAGETDRRPIRALELLRQGYGRRLLIDVPADAKIYDASQLELAQKFVAGLPDASSISVCPIFGLSTRDESHDVEKCFGSMDSHRVLIVTSDFHTRRALSIFRHELRGRVFSSAASHDDTQFGTRWWRHRQWAKTCMEEWLRTIWWNGIERWR